MDIIGLLLIVYSMQCSSHKMANDRTQIVDLMFALPRSNQLATALSRLTSP